MKYKKTEIEGRAEKDGRFRAEEVVQIIEHLILNNPQRRDWGDIFLQEVGNFSFQGTRKGNRNEVDKHELVGILGNDLYNPVIYARFVKEQFHKYYNKDTSRRAIEYMLDILDDFFYEKD